MTTDGVGSMADVNLLRKYLWSGSAAVIVGAGFSCNAERKDKTIPLPPRWTDFINAFATRILGVKGETEDELNRLHQYVDGKSALVLPQEYEALYGRTAMVAVVRSLINDNNLLPHHVHKELLRLPWADVYTTNYDTLLERAAEEINEYDYRTITLPEQIVGSKNPRIVKLHGTWHGSDKDWIVTEEDYRRYPKDYAPFVNMVRQSAMEACLCLIGFSGTDPNFLSWIGWVRDYLGTTQLPIFLILGYTPARAEAQLLKERNIVAINVFELFRDSVKDGDFQGVFLALFKYLNPDSVSREKVPCVGLWELNNRAPSEQRKNNLKSLLQRIRNYRDVLAGCPVASHYDRAVINQFDSGYHVVVDSIDELEKKDQAEALELVEWIRSLGMRPMSDELYSAYSSKIKNGSYQEEIKSSLIFLRIALWREARERHDVELWTELDSYFEDCPSIERSELLYERVLWYMAELDVPKVADIMQAWKSIEKSEEWQLKYASCLVRLGEYQAAMVEVQSALRSIRAKVPRGRRVDSKYYLYLEGIALYVIRELGCCSKVEGDVDISAINKRLDFLAGVGCDPRVEIEYFNLVLDREFKPISRTTTRRRFDETITTNHLGGGYVPTQGRVASEFVRYVEKTGLCKAATQFLPLNDTNEMRCCVNFLKWYIYLHPGRVQSLHWLIASASVKDQLIEVTYGQSALARTSSEQAESVVREILSSLNGLGSLDSTRNFISARVKIALFYLEALSRFVSRINDEDLRGAILDGGLKFINANTLEFRFEFADIKKNFLRRVLGCLSKQSIVSRLQLLLAAFRETKSGPWCVGWNDVVRYLPQSRQHIPSDGMKDISNIVEQQLREFVAGGDPNGVKDAALKLAPLENMGLFSPNQQRVYATRLLNICLADDVLDDTLTCSYITTLIRDVLGKNKASQVLNAMVVRHLLVSSDRRSSSGVHKELCFYQDLIRILGVDKSPGLADLRDDVINKLRESVFADISVNLKLCENLKNSLVGSAFANPDRVLMKLDRVMAEVVLPRINQSVRLQIRERIETDSRMDIGMFPLTDMMLSIYHGESGSIADKVLDINLFDEADLGCNAIEAMGRLAYFLRKNDSTREGIVNILVSIVRHRSDESVIAACYSLAEHVQQKPSIATNIHAMDIWRLSIQTRPYASNRFPDEKLIEFRCAAAFLAGVVYTLSDEHKEVCKAFMIDGGEFKQVIKSWSDGVEFAKSRR